MSTVRPKTPPAPPQGGGAMHYSTTTTHQSPPNLVHQYSYDGSRRGGGGGGGGGGTTTVNRNSRHNQQQQNYNDNNIDDGDNDDDDDDEPDYSGHCASFCGLVVLILSVVGTVLAGKCLTNCEFVSLYIPSVADSQVPTVPTVSPTFDVFITQDDAQFFGEDDNMTTSPFPSYGPSQSPSTAAPTTNSVNGGEVFLTIGLFVYYNTTQNDCVKYPSPQDLSVYMRTARLGITLAVLCSFIAIFVLFLEYCFCRCPCSRVIVNLGYAIAIVSTPLTFLIYLDNTCRGNVVGCDLGQGGQRALEALGVFFLTLILTCVLPKSEPFVTILRRMIKESDYRCLCWQRTAMCKWKWIGGAFFCRRRKKQKQGVDDADDYYDDMDEEDQEGVPLTIGDMSTSEQVTDEHGHSYKQYHDETAGYTLQNQYTAAYRRWLRFEEDYDVALNKFKEECMEADVNWRLFLRQSKDRRRRLKKQIQQYKQRIQQYSGVGGGASSNVNIPTTSLPNSAQTFHELQEEVAVTAAAAAAAATMALNAETDGGAESDHAIVLPEAPFEDEPQQLDGDEDEDDDDNNNMDDELLRHVDVLVTLQANCDFAREVMNRIQQDINDHAQKEDIRHLQILEKQKMEKQRTEEKLKKKKEKEQQQQQQQQDNNGKKGPPKRNRWMIKPRHFGTQQQQSGQNEETDQLPFLQSSQVPTDSVTDRGNAPSSSYPGAAVDPAMTMDNNNDDIEGTGNSMFASARMMQATSPTVTYRMDRDGDLFASARMEPGAAASSSTGTRGRVLAGGSIPTNTGNNNDDEMPDIKSQSVEVVVASTTAETHTNIGERVQHNVTRPLTNFFKAVPKRANQTWTKVVRRKGDGNNSSSNNNNNDDDDNGDNYVGE